MSPGNRAIDKMIDTANSMRDRDEVPPESLVGMKVPILEPAVLREEPFYGPHFLLGAAATLGGVAMLQVTFLWALRIVRITSTLSLLCLGAALLLLALRRRAG